MATRSRNHEISPAHANHPGWDADGCPLRLTVTPKWSVPAAPGFACSWTGGHCLPGERCDARRESARKDPTHD
jgi:hypothetical protein